MKRKQIAVVPEQVRNQHSKERKGKSLEECFSQIEKEIKDAF